jgi:hypothetical protein
VGGTAVTLTGDNFTGVSSVKFAGVSANFTTPTSATELKTVAPNNVLTGPITIVNAAGSYSSWNYFYGKPVITGFSPANGRAGTNVTILGTNFLGATSVTFGGVAASFKVESNNKITTTVPAGAPKGIITVTTPSMPMPTSSNFVVYPSITDFTPNHGAVGTSVTISGSNLKLGTTVPTVKFNGVAATPTSSSATSIVVPVPGGAQSGPISITTADGTDTTPTSFLLPPGITSFTPIRALPGTAVTILGTNLNETTDVSFAGVSASFTVVNKTNITTTVPVGTKTGSLTITTPAGTANPGLFFIPPVITGFTPASALAGASITVNGNFPDMLTNVLFNGVAASFVNNSTSSVTAVIPTNATTGPITVKSAGGTNTTATNFTVLLPSLPPQITAFSPAFGPVGTRVTLTGTNLNVGTVTVQFTGTNATPESLTLTQITVKVPNGAVSGPITVTGRDGSATTTDNFLLPPVITRVTPTNGVSGTLVTLTGTNFTNATSLFFNGNEAEFTVVNNNTITATVPASTATGPIRLVTPAGTNDTATPFWIPPVITGFSPTSGQAGTRVVISGTFPDGATSVLFNGVAAAILETNATAITVTSPEGAGIGPITVIAAGGTAVSVNSFSTTIIVLPPVITNFSPTAGPVGTQVTLTGSYLDRAPVTVKFNNTLAALTTISNAHIVTVVPVGASSGPITVTTRDGAFTTDASFHLPPVITSFTPTSALPGSSVILYGVDFTNATAVAFGGVAADFRVVNNERAVVTVPVSARTGPITLTTPAGTATSPDTFLSPPVITSFSPATGSVGSLVTLTGLFPDNATNVLFNGAAGIITLASTSQIQAVVPTNATSGPITVQAVGGSDQSANSFTLVVPKLSITRESTGVVNIHWTGASAYVLQYLTSLTGELQWGTDTNNASTTNGVTTVTTKASGTQKIYRLKAP